MFWEMTTAKHGTPSASEAFDDLRLADLTEPYPPIG
jgi:hypothetical protein